MNPSHRAPKPEVCLESREQIDELYTYYENYVPRPRVAPIAYGLMARVFKPEASFEPASGLILPVHGNEWILDSPQVSAEAGALQMIEDDLRNDVSYIILNNHQPNVFGNARFNVELGARGFDKKFGIKTTLDQYVVAGLMACFDQTKPFVGRTFVWSKDPLYNRTNASRNFIDDMRGIPIFSKRNLPRDPVTKSVDPALIALQEYSVERLLLASVALIDMGWHGALWPEGTRNDDDPTKIQKIQKGIGQLACMINPNVELRLLSVLTDYGEQGFMPHIRPRVLVRKPMQIDRRDEHGTVEAVFDNLQTGLDILLDTR